MTPVHDKKPTAAGVRGGIICSLTSARMESAIQARACAGRMLARKTLTILQTLLFAAASVFMPWEHGATLIAETQQRTSPTILEFLEPGEKAATFAELGFAISTWDAFRLFDSDSQLLRLSEFDIDSRARMLGLALFPPPVPASRAVQGARTAWDDQIRALRVRENFLVSASYLIGTDAGFTYANIWRVASSNTKLGFTVAPKDVAGVQIYSRAIGSGLKSIDAPAEQRDQMEQLLARLQPGRPEPWFEVARDLRKWFENVLVYLRTRRN